jgi:RNA-binding protein YlmH
VSRRKAFDMLKRGMIKVNDVVCEDFSAVVSSDDMVSYRLDGVRHAAAVT